MRTVRDGDGDTYLLEKRTDDASLVRDPETGDSQYLPNEDLEVVGEDPLETAADAVPGNVRRLLRVTHSDAALGLLVDLDRRGPTSIRTLLATHDRCESDLHGMIAEFRAAGVLEEVDVGGERGYRLTDGASRALDVLTR